MLVVDDVLLFPVRGISWIFKQIQGLAEEELKGESDRIRESLTDLYMMLETGQITEEEFEKQERDLLDRLDALDEDEGMIGEEEDEEGEDEDEDEKSSEGFSK